MPAGVQKFMITLRITSKETIKTYKIMPFISKQEAENRQYNFISKFDAIGLENTLWDRKKTLFL